MYGIRVPGTHGSNKNTYPSTIGTSGSSNIGFLTIKRRATSKSPATTASVLVYQSTGLPIVEITRNWPSAFASKKKRIGRSMSGQLHHGELQGLGMAAVIFLAAWMCHVHVHCHASQGFVVTAMSAPT